MALPEWCTKLGTRTLGKATLLICLLISTLFIYQKVTVKDVFLIVDRDVSVLKTRWKTVGQLLESEGLYVRGSDIVKPEQSASLKQGMSISLERAKPVFIHHDGQTHLIYTTSQNVTEILKEADKDLSPLDRVEPHLRATVQHGDHILITRINKELITEEVKIPFATETKYDHGLPSGQKKVAVQGKTGIKMLTYEVTYAEGREEERVLVGEEFLKQPVNSVVRIGTAKASPVVTVDSRSGEAVAAMEGIASWYGKDDGFQGARTASGEIFNKNALTAAHPTLPFGTLLRITYLKTGRSVEVRVNDRGPFGKDRIVDLSMAAAEAIGLRSAGIGLVRLEVLK